MIQKQYKTFINRLGAVFATTWWQNPSDNTAPTGIRYLETENQNLQLFITAPNHHLQLNGNQVMPINPIYCNPNLMNMENQFGNPYRQYGRASDGYSMVDYQQQESNYGNQQSWDRHYYTGNNGTMYQTCPYMMSSLPPIPETNSAYQNSEHDSSLNHQTVDTTKLSISELVGWLQDGINDDFPSATLHNHEIRLDHENTETVPQVGANHYPDNQLECCDHSSSEQLQFFSGSSKPNSLQPLVDNRKNYTSLPNYSKSDIGDDNDIINDLYSNIQNNIEIYGKGINFTEKCKSTDPLLHSNSSLDEKKGYFDQETFKMLEGFYNVRTSHSIKFLQEIRKSLPNLSVKEYSDAFSIYLAIYRRGIVSKNIQPWDIWHSIIKLFDSQRYATNGVETISKDPRITLFYVTMTSVAWSVDDLKALQNRIVLGNATMKDEESNNTPADMLAMINNSYYGQSTEKRTIYDLFGATLKFISRIFNDPSFKDQLISNAQSVIENPASLMLFVVRFRTLVSRYYFIDPFLRILNGVLNLQGTDNLIHEEYLNKLKIELESIMMDVLELFNCKPSILMNPNNMYSPELLQCKIFKSHRFIKRITNIINIMKDWCHALKDYEVRQHLIRNCLYSLAYFQHGLHIIFGGIYCKNKIFQGQKGLLNVSMFESLLFSGFELEPMRLFADSISPKILAISSGSMSSTKREPDNSDCTANIQTFPSPKIVSRNNKKANTCANQDSIRQYY